MDGPNAPPAPKLRVTIADALQTLPDAGRSTALMMSYGTMEVRWFAPQMPDPQTPHDRDELYIIVSGTGMFVRGVDAAPFDDVTLMVQGADRVPFGPGDALFVPAGAVHRFEEFSEDFACWVMFYGPEGGEA